MCTRSGCAPCAYPQLQMIVQAAVMGNVSVEVGAAASLGRSQMAMTCLWTSVPMGSHTQLNSQQQRLAEAHAELERIGEARLSRHEGLDGTAVGSEARLEPFGRLRGWIDDEAQDSFVGS